MTNSEKLQTQLETTLHGKPWYGTPIYSIIEGVSFEAAYEKVSRASHTIAEIVMHTLAWTEEVISRMNGRTADTPIAGDWPDVGTPEIEKWQRLVASFKLANVELAQLIANFPVNKWNEPTNDQRGTYVDYGLTYEAMIVGLTQHTVYHAAQISLLNKMING